MWVQLFPFIFKTEDSKRNILRTVYPNYQQFSVLNSSRYKTRSHADRFIRHFIIPKLECLYFRFQCSCNFSAFVLRDFSVLCSSHVNFDNFFWYCTFVLRGLAYLYFFFSDYNIYVLHKFILRDFVLSESCTSTFNVFVLLVSVFLYLRFFSGIFVTLEFCNSAMCVLVLRVLIFLSFGFHYTCSSRFCKLSYFLYFVFYFHTLGLSIFILRVSMYLYFVIFCTSRFLYFDLFFLYFILWKFCTMWFFFL